MAMNNKISDESEIVLSIHNYADIVLARAKGEKLARKIGLEKVQVGDVVIVISELSSNLLKNKVKDGKIIIREVYGDKNKGIEIISSDLNPGIADIGQSIENGYSTKGSLGIGLSAVNRLMDEFEIKSNLGEGTLITTRKWKKDELTYMPVTDFELSVFSRPIAGQRFNGDAYFVKRYEDKVILAVIDGLGHGKGAYEASQAAVNCLENCYRRRFTEIFQLCHQWLKKTRGAGMNLCRINLNSRIMTHTSIGNVQTQIYSSEETPKPFCINGTVGVTMSRIKVDDYILPENNIIIMFSDGISGRFSTNNIPGLLNLKPQELAKKIIDNYAKDYDDATVIVGRLKS